MEGSLVGKTLSHYRVLKKADAGGMGVIYRAYDERLRRPVALKVLPAGAVADDRARRRLRAEAMALSRLNHPNIETIHDFDTQDGVDFLVMEFLEGNTLQGEIAGRPMSEKDIASLGSQIADALHAAHGKRVVHRDLKPANILVTPDRRVKLLDFGIARFLHRRPDEAGTTETWTEGAGIPGTLPYMAPEQLRGETVDGRTDIYAFGVVLFEMATGDRPFKRPLTTALIDEICHQPPSQPRRLNPRVSPRLEAIILKCLDKDPERRYQSALEVKVDLLRSGEPSSGGDGLHGGKVGVGSVLRRAGVLLAGLVAALLLLLAAPGGIKRVREFVGHLLSRRPVQAPIERQVTFAGWVAGPTLSPDGMTVAYRDLSESIRGGQQRVVVQDLAGGEPLRIFEATVIGSIRWSPDGSQLAFVASGHAGAGLYVVPRLGGPPRRYPVPGFDQAWSPDGSRVAICQLPARRVFFLDLASGDSTLVPVPDPGAGPYDVDWSPRGDRLVVLTAGGDPVLFTIWTSRVGQSKWTRVLTDSLPLGSARWRPDGEGIYYLRARGSLQDLCHVGISERTGGLRGAPRVLISGMETGGAISISRDGRRLVYVREERRSNLWRLELGRRGDRRIHAARRVTEGTVHDEDPAVSPDGRWLAFARWQGETSEIHLMPSGGGPARRLTYLNSELRDPVWSPDGEEVAFIADAPGNPRICVVARHGGAPLSYPRSRPRAWILRTAWAPGRRILYLSQSGLNYTALDPKTRAEEDVFPRGLENAALFSPRVSPDGGRLAFQWNRPSSRGLWVFSFADASFRCVLPIPNTLPAGWSADGRWIYAWERGRTPPTFSVVSADSGTALPLGPVTIAGEPLNAAVAPDGTWIVCAVQEKQSDAWLLEKFDPEARSAPTASAAR